MFLNKIIIAIHCPPSQLNQSALQIDRVDMEDKELWT